MSSDFCFAILLSDDSLVSIGSFQQSVALSVDPSGNIYVIDGGTNEILKFSRAGKLLTTIGGYGWTQLSFDKPMDLIAPNGIDVYIADYGNHRIQRFDRNLNYVSTFSTRDSEQEEQRFGYPRSVSLSKFGALFIVDGENQRILKVNNLTKVERTFGGLSSGKGRLRNPARVRVGENDIVYVQDGNTIVLFDIFGNYLTSLGKEYFKNIKSFVVHSNKLYVLDSCSIAVFNEKGNFEQRVDSLPNYFHEANCEIVDLGIGGENVYLLTKHNIVKITLKEIIKPIKN
ncbi:MAG: NHL repeat-containing protein [Ignavibacteriae bacterium]|nr:NHL repeat-containing protein [Ignavibacteriota bacterium]